MRLQQLKYLQYIIGGRITILASGLSQPAQKILEARLESHEDLKQWMGWAQDVPDLERIEADLIDAENKRNELQSFRFHIFETSSERFLGSIGIIRTGNNCNTVELGYWMRKSEQGNGYVREALALMVQHMFRIGIFRVEVRCDAHNFRSMNVASSIGMKMDGVLRGDRTNPDGKYGSTKVLSLINGMDRIDFDFGDVKVKEGTQVELYTSI